MKRVPRADFPWSLQHILPFWAGAEHHDFHHMAFVNNFATSFRWCDHLAGTDAKYRAYKARLNAIKAKGLSAEEYARMELAMNEQAEREGVEAADAAERLTWGKSKVA